MRPPRIAAQHDAITDAAGAAALTQGELYAQAASGFGPALARLASAHEADSTHRQDLLQDIHLALWRSFATFEHQCSLRTWVYRVAHNVAATHVLRHKRARLSKLVSLEELAEMPDESDGERRVDEEAVLARLRALIQRLKPIDRDVFLLHLEGLEAAGIAEIVGLSAANVAQKIHRTRRVLQRHVQSGGSHVPPE